MDLHGKAAAAISDYSNRRSLGSRLRSRRCAPLLEMIDRVWRENGTVSILDVGGTRRYWTILPEGYANSRGVRFTILNTPGGEQQPDDGEFSFVEADGCDLSRYEDGAFDIVHSNSVIEHVGDWSRMLAFANEARRVGRSYFVQTPNFWFPIEPHFMTPFFHWLPFGTRVWLIRNFNLGSWKKARDVDQAVRAVESARLLTRSMVAAAFPDAALQTERLLGLPKSFLAIRQR